jgi:hypothetical protein
MNIKELKQLMSGCDKLNLWTTGDLQNYITRKNMSIRQFVDTAYMLGPDRHKSFIDLNFFANKYYVYFELTGV